MPQKKMDESFNEKAHLVPQEVEATAPFPDTVHCFMTEIFDVIGSFGPWQRRIFMIIFFMNIVSMWPNLSVTFLAPNMNYRCVYPLSSNKNNINQTFDDKCYVPQGRNLVPCTRWEYDTSSTSQTIVSKWDLVCEREWLISLAKSVYMIGFLVSVIASGQISDCIGRFPTIAICYVIGVVSMFLSLLSESFTMFLILRFFQAFFAVGACSVGYVLIMEIIGPKHHSKIGIAIQLSGSIGFTTLAGVAWIFRHWFWFQLVLCLFSLPVAFVFKHVSESPRWLLMQGEMEKLERLLSKAAKLNGRNLHEEIKDVNILKLKTKNKKKVSTLFEVFKMPKMRCRILNMFFLWMVNCFLYYGLSYNSNDLAGNPYLNFFVSGVLEFPSLAVLYWSIDRYGRRTTLISFMICGGSACAAILLVPAAIPWLATAFAMLGKFFVTGSFGLLYLYTTELFPTGVRNACLGSCSMCARLGSILAPFVRDLGKATHYAVPNILFALLAFTSSLLALMLPETRGLPIPDTLQEGEDLELLTKEAEESLMEMEILKPYK